MEIEVEESRYLRIRFTNGTERSFAFSPLSESISPATIATHVQKMLDSRRLILQMDDRMIVIPFDNVESFEVVAPSSHPLPEALHIQHEFT